MSTLQNVIGPTNKGLKQVWTEQGYRTNAKAHRSVPIAKT